MSADGSSEHWSFENLTQSTDSGFPLLGGGDSRKSQNLPLSLVLNNNSFRGGADGPGLPARSLSTGSTRGVHLLRRQVGCRPGSETSDTLSDHLPPLRLYGAQGAHRAHSSMAGSYAPRMPGTEAAPTPVSVPGEASRASAASDRAVFARSRSPEHSLFARGSVSPPPAAYMRQSGEGGRLGISYRPCHSDDQLQGAPPLQLPASPQLSAQRRIRSEELGSRQQSIVALSAGAAHYGADGAPDRRVDPPEQKAYGLPETCDALGHSGGGQWRRARVERDYSQGDARRFAVVVPEQLRGRIDEQRFKRFVRRLNAMMAEAEGATLRNVLEGCLAFATLYISTLILKPRCKRTAERISAFIASENKTLFEPAGLMAIDPLQTAYMFLEVVVL